ncbi:maltose-binding protein /trehalose-binding protein /sucrose-binding protein /palatinose-binding protein [Kushneria avicenniae]|uniref:Maltose-binding protein /trehalose-binding protein /sucrose-binding protein /palatinose-binding protein n=1 Tax=Kushneria avicenniae TaxID=402385 RepID=A0A1I1MN81_9GAMM|nr:ABC transporter substrate-binding protein [Kushneria avicenniae]SFC86556.1 maltose-binding protein /trehalose-binding protein /sucrose-binding protein /palatinose-binding protein [Kushneria avicenniae]
MSRPGIDRSRARRCGWRATLGLAALLGATGGAQAAEVAIACGGGGDGDYCPIAARAWAAQTGHSVRVVTTPNATTEKLALFQQLLNSHSQDVDVMMVDIAWPGLLAPHLVDLGEAVPPAERKAFFPALIEANTVDGRLVALPWYTDAGLLYYRKDLLDKYQRPVPETWQEMNETASSIQQAERDAGDDEMWGFVFQGRAYEGLTCNALEWIAGYGGGRIVDTDGAITVDNAQATAALTEAASWIGSIAPRGVLNYTEEEARGVFQSGNAVFMRNWPYVWSLAQREGSPVSGRIGVAPLPHGPGADSTSTLGGWNFAVSRYTDTPEAAISLARYMTSAEVQRQHALNNGMNPTRIALYDDAEVITANPTMTVLRPVLMNAVARPSAVTGDAYARVSNAVFNNVHEVLSGRAEPAAALDTLDQTLTRLKRRQW